MSEEKRILELDKYEYGVIFHSLNDKRTALLKEKQPTDAIDDVLIKVIDAPSLKKRRERYRTDER